MPGIVGLGVACEIVRRERAGEAKRVERWRDHLLSSLRANLPDLKVNGSLEHRLPNNLNVSFPGVDGEELVKDLQDVAVSSGSACTSAALDSSYVLKSLYGDDEAARGSLRFGLGRSTTREEIDLAAAAVTAAVERLRSSRPGTATADAVRGCGPIE